MTLAWQLRVTIHDQNFAVWRSGVLSSVKGPDPRIGGVTRSLYK